MIRAAAVAVVLGAGGAMAQSGMEIGTLTCKVTDVTNLVLYTSQSFDYVGAGADVVLSQGVGAQVLVGGGDNSFSLQPVSVSGVEGVGASLGLESFTLK